MFFAPSRIFFPGNVPAPSHLNDLRAFETAARRGSFAGAAGELSVTPAAVGQRVRGLEKVSGVTLLNRAAGLRAAIDGEGIALAHSVVGSDDVASGSLIQLCPTIGLASTLAYFVVYRPACASRPKPVAFRAWLFEQAVSPGK